MVTIESIKRWLAIIILACFFLPLYQCSTKAPANTTSNQEAPSVTEALIPFEEIHFKNIDELVIVSVFAWPLGFWIVRRSTTTAPKKLLINLAEVICGAASLTYLILIFRLWGELRYGGVIALLAFSSYVITSVTVLSRYALRKVI